MFLFKQNRNVSKTCKHVKTTVKEEAVAVWWHKMEQRQKYSSGPPKTDRFLFKPVLNTYFELVTQLKKISYKIDNLKHVSFNGTL